MKNPAKLSDVYSELERIKDELENLHSFVDIYTESKQEKFDSHSEKWQESDAATDAQEKLDALENTRDQISEAVDCCSNAMDSLSELQS